MPSTTSLLAAGAVLLFIGLHHLVYNKFFSPLAKVPVPHWSCHFAPFWLWWAKLAHQENQLVYKNHMSQGPALRLSPGLLSINSFDDGLKPIYLGGFPKTEFYIRGFMNYNTHNIFTFQDNAEHSARKRLISNTFSKSFILSSPTAAGALRDVLFGRLLPMVAEAARTGQPIDMLETSYAYSMDSFVQWQFGRRLGSNLLQNKAERRLYLEGFFAAAPYTFWQYELPGLNRLLKAIGTIPRKVDSGFHDIEQWNIEKCDGAYKMLQSGEELTEEENPVVFAQAAKSMTKIAPGQDSTAYPNRLEIASDMFAHNSAAHETSGNTLGYLYYEMSRHPEIQAKLRRELMTLQPPLVMSTSKGQEGVAVATEMQLPSPKDVDALPYLEAVIMETLRLYPSVPGGQPRKVPRPCTLGGHDNIPAGTTVQCYAYSIHRTPEIFPEPERWNPDRWVTAEKEQLLAMKRWFWAFGSGARMCIGSNFAWFSMKHVVAGVYTNFETQIHETGSMDLLDSYLAGPKGHKVEIKFTAV